MRARSVIVGVAVALLFGGGAYRLLTDRADDSPEESTKTTESTSGSRAPAALEVDPVAARKREAAETKTFLRGLFGGRDDKSSSAGASTDGGGARRQSKERREPPGPPQHVTGIVVDENEQPVKEAIVWAEAPIDVGGLIPHGQGGCVTATTGADGRFDLVLPARTWGFLRARKGRLVSRDVMGRTFGSVDNRIVLVASVTLTVRVESAATRQPVGDADVRAFANGDMWRMQLRSDIPGARAATNPEGIATLTVPRVRREDVHVLVKAQGFAPQMSAAPDEADSGWSVRVPLASGGTIRGRVVDSAGASVVGATVVAGDDEKASGDSGEFVFEHVRVGPEYVRVKAEKRGFPDKFTEVKIESDGAVATVDLVLPKPISIEGRVVFADGTSAAGLRVSQYSQADDTYQSGHTDTASDGRFRLDGVAPGRHMIMIADDHQILWEETVDAPASGLSVPLLLRVPAQFATTRTLRVRVTDTAGRGVAKALVHCDPSFLLLFTDQDGSCSFSNLPHGVVSVGAWSGASNPVGRDVDLSERDGDVTISLGGFEIAGRVVASDGPVRGEVAAQWVSTRPDTTPIGGTPRFTDDAGRFRIADVGGGDYRLRFRARGGTTWQDGQVVHAGDRDVVFHVADADAEKRREFVIDVTDTDGQVLAPREVGMRLHTEKGPASDFLRAAPILGVLGSYRGSLPLDLPAGDYTLTIGGEKPYAGVRLDGIRLAPELGPYHWKVAFGRGPSVGGHVVRADGSPAQYAQVYSKESSQPDERSRAPVAVAADGSYFLDALEEGPLTVFVRDHYALTARKTITLGTTGTATVDFRLEPAGGVRLVFPERMPRSRCDVTLTPANGGDARTLTSGGRLESADDVAPGRYRATVAWDGADGGTTEIDVVAGSTTPIVLPLK